MTSLNVLHSSLQFSKARAMLSTALIYTEVDKLNGWITEISYSDITEGPVLSLVW